MSAACEALAADASGGVAPALRAVDCLANEMAAGAFSRLFGTQGSLLPALTVLLTLYIAFFAFSLITGRSRLGISVLTPRMLTLGLVLTFATSWLAWQQVVWNLAVGAPDQIVGVLMGTRGSATVLFADRIDMVVGAIAEVGGQGDPQGAAQATANNGTFSANGAMWLGAMLLLLGTVGILVTARIVLAVLLATGPVFVVMGLFGPTRGLTGGWLKGLIMAGLTPLFVTLGGSLMIELAVPVVAALRSTQGSVDPRAAMALFLIASVHCALMMILFKVAGTMVAGWNAFGLVGSRGRDEVPVSVQPAAQAVNQTIGSASGFPAQANDPSRAAALTRASIANVHTTSAATAAESPATSIQRNVVVQQSGDNSGLPALPRTRARGIGSRFASARATTPPREMIR